MAHDTYARPPAPAHGGAITRRALLRLRPPASGPDVHAVSAARGAVEALAAHPGRAALGEALAPVGSVIAEVAGAARDAGVLEAASLDELESRPGGYDLVAAPFDLALDPEPARVVEALGRAVSPGGTVAVAAWAPRGLPGRLFEFAEHLVPLPPGVPSPSDWGRSNVAARRLGGAFAAVEIRTRVARLRFGDPDVAFRTLSAAVPFPAGRDADLRPAFDRLLASCNDASEGVEIAGRYVLALGRAPA
jgi:hypothetical protein